MKFAFRGGFSLFEFEELGIVLCKQGSASMNAITNPKIDLLQQEKIVDRVRDDMFDVLGLNLGDAEKVAFLDKVYHKHQFVSGEFLAEKNYLNFLQLKFQGEVDGNRVTITVT